MQNPRATAMDGEILSGKHCSGGEGLGLQQWTMGLGVCLLPCASRSVLSGYHSSSPPLRSEHQGTSSALVFFILEAAAQMGCWLSNLLYVSAFTLPAMFGATWLIGPIIVTILDLFYCL